MNVYINKISKFLPGEGVNNQELDNYLEVLDNNHQFAKKVTLKNNGIKKRYYALDKNHNNTYSNAEMTAKAIHSLNIKIDDIEYLSCGTSTPDLFIPSHTSMVHGELDMINECEISGVSGICCSGMFAMKNAYMSILSNNSKNAVISGSELVSTYMLSKNFMFNIPQEEIKNVKKDIKQTFGRNFLRWMLSDGAGAMYLTNKPNKEDLSLKIHWIDSKSYANEMDTCMYIGASKNENGTMNYWRNYNLTEENAKNFFTIQQDVNIVKEMPEFCIKKHFNSIKKKYNLNSSDEIDYFLPHLSSKVFFDKTYQFLKEENFEIPKDKWFTNLTYVGNTGAASIYLMLEELFNHGQKKLDENLLPLNGESKKIKKGEKILCIIPESGKFASTWMLLEVV